MRVIYKTTAFINGRYVSHWVLAEGKYKSVDHWRKVSGNKTAQAKEWRLK